MSTAKQRFSSRAALTRAIENKVGRMDMASLLELASSLKVPVPPTAKSTRSHVRKPVAHVPARARKVLQGGGIGRVVSAAEGRKRLDAITVDEASAGWVESELVGAGELVARLTISRGTLDNWRKANKVIALRKGLRNFVYPLRQFDRRGPVEGLDVIASLFTSSEAAWEWLVAPNRMTGGKPPIDKLRDGDVALVESAAEGEFDYA